MTLSVDDLHGPMLNQYPVAPLDKTTELDDTIRLILAAQQFADWTRKGEI